MKSLRNSLHKLTQFPQGAAVKLSDAAGFVHMTRPISLTALASKLDSLPAQHPGNPSDRCAAERKLVAALEEKLADSRDSSDDGRKGDATSVTLLRQLMTARAALQRCLNQPIANGSVFPKYLVTNLFYNPPGKGSEVQTWCRNSQWRFPFKSDGNGPHLPRAPAAPPPARADHGLLSGREAGLRPFRGQPAVETA